MSEGCNAVFANLLSYIGTPLFFISVFFVPMPHLPHPVIDNLLPVKVTHYISPNYRYVILALWCIHFLRRITEVLFVHIYNRKMSVLETVGGPIYYWCFAVFNAWAIRKESYHPGPLISIVLGIFFFAIGEIGNCWCHYRLRQFRLDKCDNALLVSDQKGRVIPYGGIFEVVTSPHYFFEIITWFGFFLVTWTIWAMLFLFCTIITLVIYSKKKHEAYQQQFDGIEGRPLYPKRKILIPFIF